MRYDLASRDMAFCGLFGAAALLLPVFFHILHLGHIFMPMYLPLVALAFFVRPLPAMVTAFISPLLSGAVTGMPPFYPPIALFMAIELALMAGLIAFIYGQRPNLNEWIGLVPVLILGRALYVALVYLFSSFVDLPAKFMAGVSFLSGWPGIILMVAVVPVIARTDRARRRRHTLFQEGNTHDSKR